MLSFAAPDLPLAVADNAVRQARDLYATSIASLLFAAFPPLRRRPAPDGAHFASRLSAGEGDSPVTVFARVRDDFKVEVCVGGPVPVVARLCSDAGVRFRALGRASLGQPAQVGNWTQYAKGRGRQELTVRDDQTADVILLLEPAHAARALMHLPHGLVLPRTV